MEISNMRLTSPQLIRRDIITPLQLPQQEPNLFDEIKVMFERWVEEAEADTLDLDEDEQFRTKAKTITKFYNTLNDFNAYIEKNHKKELWAKGNYFPKKWMLDDPIIVQVLQKYRLIDILNYLDKHNLNPKTNEYRNDLKFYTETKKGQEVAYQYSLLQLDRDFYRQAEEALSLKQITIQKYVQQFCKMDALRRLKKVDKKWLYADGYYTLLDNGRLKKNRFLKQTPAIKKALREFRIK